MIWIVIQHWSGPIGNWVFHSRAFFARSNTTHSSSKSRKTIRFVSFDMVNFIESDVSSLHIRFFLGAFETILVSWFTLFDGEHKLMLTPDFSAYMDRDFIKTIKTLGAMMLEIFDLGMKASHLRWTDSDIALFNALILMNPGELRDNRAVLVMSCEWTISRTSRSVR